jgi:hypothetical protein
MMAEAGHRVGRQIRLDATRTSLATVIWLLLAFGLGSVLFWAYFRFRPQPGIDSPSPPAPSAEPPSA